MAISCLYMPTSSIKWKAPEELNFVLLNFVPLNFARLYYLVKLVVRSSMSKVNMKSKNFTCQIILGDLLERGNMETIFHQVQYSQVSFGVGTGQRIITSFICIKLYFLLCFD